MAQPKLYGYTGNWAQGYHGADLATWTLSATSSSYAGTNSNLYPVTLVLHVTGNNTIRIEAGSATLDGHGVVTWPETFMRLGDGGAGGHNTDRYYKTDTSDPNSPYSNGTDNLLIYNDMTDPGYPSNWFQFQNLTATIAGLGNGRIAGPLTEGAPPGDEGDGEGEAAASGDPFITPMIF